MPQTRCLLVIPTVSTVLWPPWRVFFSFVNKVHNPDENVMHRSIPLVVNLIVLMRARNHHNPMAPFTLTPWTRLAYRNHVP